MAPVRHLRLVVEGQPRTRGDCASGPRPCIFTGCRHHGGKDIVADTESCTLDVADRGPQRLEDIAALFGVTKERIRQIEEKALRKLSNRVDRELLQGWTNLVVRSLPEDAEDYFGAEFRTAVSAAYERIVPANERGSQLLRWKEKKA